MVKSTRPAHRRKPRLPLWLHTGTGQWAKKIKGKVYYFGNDYDIAVAEWFRVKDDLVAGRTPRPASQAVGPTLLDLCNHFMTTKKHHVATGELTQRSYQDYFDTCERLLTHFGKSIPIAEITPMRLLQYRGKFSVGRGLHTLGNEVTRVRVVLNAACELGLIDSKLRFGDFKRPKKKAFRKDRIDSGEKMFEPVELRTLIDEAPSQLKAMILLGLNAGFGNADCGTLPREAVDLDSRWVIYPRPKTGVTRRCPLWEETAAAIARVNDLRPKPKNQDDDHLVFLTRCGHPWHVDDGKPQTAISHEFRDLLLRLDLYKKGHGFYTLRHIFQTIGDETGDETAVRIIMGHVESSMSAVYRERFPVQRLKKVVQHVHDWLYREGNAAEGAP